MSKEKIKEFIKSFSDKHKDLHANISKIGKTIDKVCLFCFLHFSLVLIKNFRLSYRIEFHSRLWQFTPNKHIGHERKANSAKPSHMRAFAQKWVH